MRLNTILFISVISLVSCNGNPTPCDCASAYVNQESKTLKKCDEYYSTLNEHEKEDWARSLNDCKPVRNISNDNSSNNTQSFPPEVQNKIDKVNQLISDESNINGAADEYSRAQLDIMTKKMGLLESANELMKEIENSGYADKIENFNGMKTKIGFTYAGVKMQKEALQDMVKNGTIK